MTRVKQRKALIIGANGQIGTELAVQLRLDLGEANVVASDLRSPREKQNGPFELLDTTDLVELTSIVERYEITEVYQLAALLSATAEQKPDLAWSLNMDGLFHVLNLAKDGKIDKVFWPSSIAVFGPNTPSNDVPQHTITDPTSVYGISKLAGERWCEYYHKKYGVDVRSLRYPGLIGYKSDPGGGTTDYAVTIFHEAVSTGKFTCFLKEDTALPMMYMEDAIRATINLMNADSERLTIRSSYNLNGISFTPARLAEAIQHYIPDFQIAYEPDTRQQIADSWPNSINGDFAKKDWDWKPQTSLEQLVDLMLKGVQEKRNLLTS